MPSKRSPGSDSSFGSGREEKRPKLDDGVFEGLSMYIIQSKIDPEELDLLYSLAENNGAEVQTDIQKADVIVTSISMRRRLERHVSWEVAKRKAVVTPAWITQSVANKKRLECGDYAAVCVLEKCTVANCPGHSPQKQDTWDSSSSPVSARNLNYMSRFAVQRASPLVCPNQDLVEQLAVIRDARKVDGDERSATSYSRSIAALKAYPFPIKTTEQISHLPFIGPKILGMTREYINNGKISETTRISNTPRFQSLFEFTRIHGIGPTTARKLYSEGCRSLEDLDRYFGAEYGRTEEDESVPDGEVSGIRVALELRDELAAKIPKSEVEKIDRVIGKELEEIEPGCVRTICGGYRRGKEMSNDVDIIYSHKKTGRERDLCKKLVARLRKQGLATHVFHSSSFRSANPLHAPAGASRPDRPHWDTLDKALIIFRLPATETFPKRLHRRVDLIFAPIETYWTAVVGWTGSTLFERDLRLWAKQKMGMKFSSSGITRRRDTKQYFPKTEHAVFELFGLEFIDPKLRNADP